MQAMRAHEFLMPTHHWLHQIEARLFGALGRQMGPQSDMAVSNPGWYVLFGSTMRPLPYYASAITDLRYTDTWASMQLFGSGETKDPIS
jgi:hypothetical protein